MRLNRFMTSLAVLLLFAGGLFGFLTFADADGLNPVQAEQNVDLDYPINKVDQKNEHWIGAWSASPQQPYETGISHHGFNDQTIRMIVHPHLDGTAFRLKFANTFSENPLTIGKVTVAKGEEGSQIQPGTLHDVQFGGMESITIPPGAQALSDPVTYPVSYGEDLTVSVYFPDETGPATWHRLSRQTSYISTSGDYTTDVNGTAYETEVNSWFYLEAVDVVAKPSVKGAIVTLGDSITDGHSSTLNANHRWPNYLAERIQERGEGRQYSVLNSGISGNKILRDSPVFGVNALARLDRDVITQSGVTHVILLEGINDIGHQPHTLDANEIIAGMKQIVDQTHAAGLKIYGGTLTPFEGTTIEGYYTEEGEQTRQEVNHWIRTGGYFDGVIDFDKALRDPENPLRLRPEFDSGDHLHPNDAGYKAMAEAIDLSLFR
jgi:lysophospholipase L1-like esterase